MEPIVPFPRNIKKYCVPGCHDITSTRHRSPLFEADVFNVWVNRIRHPKFEWYIQKIIMSYLHKFTEKIVECPFDKSHKVRETGLQYHIVRCMKNHPGYKTCPYNATHRIKGDEAFEKHIMNCPDKEIMNIYKDMFITKHGDVSETPVHVGNSEWNTLDEDWSKD